MDLRTQEIYYTKIVERYNQTRPEDIIDGHGINDAFASLSLGGDATYGSREKSISGKAVHHGGQVHRTSPTSDDLSVILMAMRKLREAIIASARMDTFALNVYIFIIRATILLKHMESYHPALLYLLQKIHPYIPLTKSQLNELLGYYILDFACRQDDLAAAYQAKNEYRYTDGKVEAVLKALVHGDWRTFWVLRDVLSVHQAALMTWAEERLRVHTLNCLGKSYLSVDQPYLERSVRRSWNLVVAEHELDWQVEGETVVIRRMKRK